MYFVLKDGVFLFFKDLKYLECFFLALRASLIWGNIRRFKKKKITNIWGKAQEYTDIVKHNLEV